MHSSIISRVSFTFKVCPFSPCGCLGPFFTIVERSHVFNLRAAEKEIFLLRWFQDLPAEACKSGQIYLSCSAEVIPETSSCCLQCHRVQFVLRNRSSVENLDKKKTPLFVRILHHLAGENAEVYDWVKFCKGGRFEAYHSDMGSKRTNHKFGCFGEVRQSNILIPSKIPFITKCVFPKFFFF